MLKVFLQGLPAPLTMTAEMAESLKVALRDAAPGETVHAFGDMTSPKDYYFRIPASAVVVIVNDD